MGVPFEVPTPLREHDGTSTSARCRGLAVYAASLSRFLSPRSSRIQTRSPASHGPIGASRMTGAGPWTSSSTRTAPRLGAAGPGDRVVRGSAGSAAGVHDGASVGEQPPREVTVAEVLSDRPARARVGRRVRFILRHAQRAGGVRSAHTNKGVPPSPGRSQDVYQVAETLCAHFRVKLGHNVHQDRVRPDHDDLPAICPAFLARSVDIVAGGRQSRHRCLG